MRVLVKKEIRLLLPAWIVAVLLAMVQGIARPYDFYVASLLFFGLTILALTAIGRESSLNTFSSLLAQPAERIRTWQVKLSVLSGAFLIVLVVWLAAFGIAYFNSSGDQTDRENSYNLFIAVCLIATATFTGGLWTTLLIRQVAGAFWLTLLVPATLSGCSCIFLANSESASLVIAVLSVIIGIYSIAGFLFARWLYFRAQDVGWSGGVISLPEWKWFAARSEAREDVRIRRPTFALVKKELHLQRAALAGATALLVLNAGVIVLLRFHEFRQSSPAGFLIVTTWLSWLVLPVVVGCIPVAEERKLGVAESQMCLPASRRLQFSVKMFVAFGLGTLLGGLLPVFVAAFGTVFARTNLAMAGIEVDSMLSVLGIMTLVSVYLTLVGFFASSVAKNFLQSLGFAVVTAVVLGLIGTAISSRRMILLDQLPVTSILPLIIFVPTALVTLLWLACLNFDHFREGWPLWRRQLKGVAVAGLFVFASSNALYYRVWEIIEPAEPAHGPARFSPAQPLELKQFDGNLQVRLPDGRIWVDYLTEDATTYYLDGAHRWYAVLKALINPFPKTETAQLITGTNWLQVIAPFGPGGHITSIGVNNDGTIWCTTGVSSDRMASLVRLGAGQDWKQIAPSFNGYLLLKQDGTLWQTGTERGWDPSKFVSEFHPVQVNSSSDWKELYQSWPGYARKTDGSIWDINVGKDKTEFRQRTNWDEVDFSTLAFARGLVGYVRGDGTLRVIGFVPAGAPGKVKIGFKQVGQDSSWRAVSFTDHAMVALKKDGTLWQWNLSEKEISIYTESESLNSPINVTPVRLGIHQDWLAISSAYDGIITLAADGSLWFWPDEESYNGYMLLKTPKQPGYLGNVFSAAD